MTGDPVARVVLRWLRCVLPAAVAEDIVGDLLEDFERRDRGRRGWLIRQAVNLTLGFGRPVPPSAPRERGAWQADLRYALRSLRRSKTPTAVTVASLALGLGLTTAVYSVVDAVLLRPLPFESPDEIVRIREVRPEERARVTDDVSRGLLGRWISARGVLAAVTTIGVEDALIKAVDTDTAAVVARVSDGFFDVLSVAPAAGRLFDAQDTRPDAPTVAVLGHAYWRQVLGGSPDVIGRSLAVGGQVFEIVGVLPPSFGYPSGNIAAFLLSRYRWPDPSLRAPSASVGPALMMLARLKPGASLDAVSREGDQLWAAVAADAGFSVAAPTFTVRRLQDDLSADVRPALLVLLTAAACVLIITCVNLTNVLLARGTVRQREMALRAALGASRWGMSRALACESVIISGLGAVLGILGAHVLLVWLPEYTSLDPALAAQIQVNGRVLLFVSVVTTGIAVLLGALPAWQAPAGRVKEALSSSHVHVLPGASLKAEHLRGLLVVVQVSLAIVLVVAAALLSRSLVGLLRVDLGFDPDHVAAFQVRLPAATDMEYGWRAQFSHALVQRLEGAPGVTAAGFTTALPMHNTFSNALVQIEGVSDLPPNPRSHREAISSHYFRAVGMRVNRGRGLTSSDTETSERVVVVNEAFVHAFLPGRDPLTHRVMSFARDWYRIVGVVADKRHLGRAVAARPEMYHALRQAPIDVVQGAAAGFVVRVTGPVSNVWPLVRSGARDLMPGSAVHGEADLSERVWASSARPRFYATIAGTFAVLALTTSLVGLYGVMAFAVERRKVEIGIRRALGATPAQISRLVLSRGLAMVAVGMVIGAIGAATGVSSLRSLLYGVEPLDAATFAGVTVLMPLIAVLACYLPARRATDIQPLDALRED